MDPYSLPINKLPGPKGVITESVQGGLVKVMKNAHDCVCTY